MDPSVNSDQTNTTPTDDGSNAGVTPVAPATDTTTPSVQTTDFGGSSVDAPSSDPVTLAPEEPVAPPATDTPAPTDAPVPDPNEAPEVSAQTDQPEAPAGGAF